MTRAVQEQANGTTRLEMRLAKPKPKDMASSISSRRRSKKT